MNKWRKKAGIGLACWLVVSIVVTLAVGQDASTAAPKKRGQAVPNGEDLSQKDDSGASENILFTGEDDDTHLDKVPIRTVMGLDLMRMGWKYDCMECHRHVDDPRFDREEIKVEHETIVLNHGNNRYCLNCHHPENRNAFVDYDGTEIPEADVTLLCAKCHGPKYRDWKAGVHGRQNGYWDPDKGVKTKLRCIQCHDPHAPGYPKIEPLAAPSYPKRSPGKSSHATH